MGGFFGIVSNRPCVHALFYGVDYHSHLGTRRAGMVTINTDGRFARSIHSIENSYFRNKFEDDLGKFNGLSGIGVISDKEPQPIVIQSHLGPFTLVTVSKINNLTQLAGQLIDRGINFTELSSGDINPSEVVGHMITLGRTFEEGIQGVLDAVEGSCSLLVLTHDGIYAARDKCGRTPIVVGKALDQSGYAFASESCSFPNLGYVIHDYLGPGQISFAASDRLETRVAPRKKCQICSFLWIYYGFPTSCYEGINVDQVRFNNGVALAKQDPVEVDAVCSIPDSGTGMAMGYAVGKGVPYRRAVAKYTPTWPRSFMPSNQELRSLVARMKLLPNPEVLKGARLACCDDSIVRGTQLRDNVTRLYAYGAKEIHIRISCPPLIFSCPYLNFSASKSDLELITRRYIATQKEQDLSLYLDTSTPQYRGMVAHICNEMHFNSLMFNTIENLVAAIGLPKESICTHCFDGTGCNY